MIMKHRAVIMRQIALLFIAMAALAMAVPALAEEEDVFLSDLVPLYENNVHECLQFNTVYWQPDIVIDGVIYEKGLGMHAPAPGARPNPNCTYFQDVGHISARGTVAWTLDGAYETFLSRIALAEQNGAEFSSDGVIFRVYLDGKLIYDSRVVLFSTPPIDIALDISGGATLVLEVDARSSHFADHSVWANARLRPGVIEMAVDIKPQSCPNPLNVNDKGVSPVAILGTQKFDVTKVDVATIKLEGVSPLRSALEDMATPFLPFSGKKKVTDCSDKGPDGFSDLTLKFDNQAVVAALGPVSDGEVRVLKLTGNLKPELGGTSIVGEDVVVIRKKGKK
jgi:hypothetical protein